MSWSSIKTSARSVIKTYNLLIALIVAIIIAISWPWLGEQIAKPHIGSQGAVQLVAIVIIFLFSGLQLKTADIKSVISNWPCVVYGVVNVILITPFIGFITIHLNFLNPAFRYGMTTFSTISTTVNTNILLCTIARGNSAMNLLVTVICTFISCFTTPLILKLIITSAGNISIDPFELIEQLIVTAMIPLVIGKTIREVFPKAVNQFLTSYKMFITTYNCVALATIVNMSVSTASANLKSLPGSSTIILIVCGIIFHCVLLCYNGILLFFLSRKRSNGTRFFPIKESKGLLILCSQKALAIALVVIPIIGSSISGVNPGLLSVPCVICQAAQSIIDSIVAGQLAKVKNDDEIEQDVAIDTVDAAAHVDIKILDEGAKTATQ